MFDLSDLDWRDTKIEVFQELSLKANIISLTKAHKSPLLIRAGLPQCSSNELANTTGGLDSLLSNLGELLSSDDAWSCWEGTRSQDLEEALEGWIII